MDGGRCDGTTAAAGGIGMDDGLRSVAARACGAWRLPGDPTCASIARHTFRRVADALALDPEVTGDGVTMVSELAANTLHAKAGSSRERDDREQRATPELWLYLRGAGARRELVCKVFDAFPGWLHGNVPGRGAHRAPADAISGRGLEVVHELSQGRWGYHMTRARLGGWQVRGKAVWFAVPAAGQGVREPAPGWMSAGAAMTRFEEMLADRGYAGQPVRADDPAADMAVLSVRGGLTVWCWCGVAWVRAAGISSRQWDYGDLVEVAEQAVEAYESLAAGSGSALLADTASCGALPPRRR